jgi:phage shock protein E
MNKSFFFILFILVLNISCNQPQKPSTSQSQTNPKLGYQLAIKGAPLIDVRTSEEYQSGHIENANLIPLQDIEQRIKEVENLVNGDKTKPVVLYCRSGRRSGLAKEILLKHGFSNVINIGGINDWPEK